MCFNISDCCPQISLHMPATKFAILFWSTSKCYLLNLESRCFYGYKPDYNFFDQWEKKEQIMNFLTLQKMCLRNLVIWRHVSIEIGNHCQKGSLVLLMWTLCHPCRSLWQTLTWCVPHILILHVHHTRDSCSLQSFRRTSTILLRG